MAQLDLFPNRDLGDEAAAEHAAAFRLADPADRVDALIALAGRLPYRWGDNDCITLAFDILHASGHRAKSIIEASKAAHEFHALSYPEALALATRRGGTIGAVMLGVADGLGLPRLAMPPEPPAAGVIAFAEGRARRRDGHVHDTATAGTLDLFFGSAPWPYSWTTEGLKPWLETFADPWTGLDVTGAVQCLPQ